MQPSTKKPTPTKREYPPFFEKAIPIALALIGLLIIVLLGVIVYVEFFAH